MRDAIGGLVNIVIIVVFLVIVSGYLAFNVNYTKAFRVKNKIISVYEQYEGNCRRETCQTEIQEYMKKIGYNIDNTPRISGYDCTNSGYCILEKCTRVQGDIDLNGNETKCYYKIVTQITLDIPVINKVMSGMNTFQITGDTKSFKKRVR